MPRHFFVIDPIDAGDARRAPLKTWLRQHPEHVPAGLNPNRNNTWTIRKGLERNGWSAVESETEVHLTMPIHSEPSSISTPVAKAVQRVGRITEDTFADRLASEIAGALKPHKVERKRSLLYELSVDHHGVVTLGVDPDSGEPIRGGGHGFEQDILVFDEVRQGHTSVVPLIVAEVKFGGVTTHDVIVYSEKADRIRRVYPYLRYGFVLGGMSSIPGRVLRLGQRFDFIAALSADLKSDELDGFRQLMQAEAAASLLLTELLFAKRRCKLIQKPLAVK